jgi:hypothetical protein
MNGDFVLGFDGSSGRTRAGTADSTALVALPVTRPAIPHVVGYWPDDGTDGWEPPRGEITATVDRWLADPHCVGGGFDPSGWQDEVAGWQAAHGAQLRTRNLALSTARRAWAWSALHEAISRRVIVLDRAAAHYDLLRAHLLAARVDDFDRVSKAHRGRHAERIDLAAALAYATVARLDAIEHGSKPALSSPPSWPARIKMGNRWTGESTDWRPVNVPCAHPRCENRTAASFCCEDHLAEYRGWWPEDPQLTRRRKLVAPPGAEPADRLVATYGPQDQADTHVIADGNGHRIVDDRPVPSRFL